MSKQCSAKQQQESTYKKKLAFTLAEVLITLGIIGVVAAMTLPTLVQNYKKKATVTSIKKFYNIINNAVQFSVAENGDVEGWMGSRKNLTYAENLDFLKKYFLPYIKYNRYDNCYENSVCIYMVDGGMFQFYYDQNGADFIYFVNGKFERSTRNSFAFQFNKHNGFDENDNEIQRVDQNRKTRVEPYVMGWDGTYEGLKNHRRGCKNPESGEGPTGSSFCTKLLQMNNWEVTDDYPW